MYEEISGQPDPVLGSAEMISYHEREIAELSVDRESWQCQDEQIHISEAGLMGTRTRCKTHQLHKCWQGGGRREGIPTNPANDGADLVSESSKPDLARFVCN
ncbi:hypothetical protein [Nitrosospira multiformis]|uniref:hypothetical protein n=1 Tax=Nitrosospira multiformis TaxID=1231 RepID=UPI0009422707|nr:hypothetical protein [Nitrosospira multiformis]